MPSWGSERSFAIRVRDSRQLRPGPVTVTGAESATRARRAAGASILAVTAGAAATTGSGVGVVLRSGEASARTIAFAAASRSSACPVRSAMVSIRRPRRTSAALTAGRSTSFATLSSANSSAAFDTAIGGSTSAPKKRVRSRRNPRIGPNPSLVRAAAATAAFQSG